MKPVPSYSLYRGGLNAGSLELLSDILTVATQSGQDETGAYYYNDPLKYTELPASSLANPFYLTPNRDPFFAQPPTPNASDSAFFRAQFVAAQKDLMAIEGSSLVLQGKFVLPAAPWFDYSSFMNQYNWFYRALNNDLQDPKGYEKLHVVSVAPRHDLNNLVHHYEITVATNG